jgi:hypothetical protein
MIDGLNKTTSFYYLVVNCFFFFIENIYRVRKKKLVRLRMDPMEMWPLIHIIVTRYVIMIIREMENKQ